MGAPRSGLLTLWDMLLEPAASTHGAVGLGGMPEPCCSCPMPWGCAEWGCDECGTSRLNSAARPARMSASEPTRDAAFPEIVICKGLGLGAYSEAVHTPLSFATRVAEARERSRAAPM